MMVCLSVRYDHPFGGYMMARLSVRCVHPFGGYMMAHLSVHCVHSFMKRGSFQHSLDCALAPLYLSLEALGKVCVPRT